MPRKPRLGDILLTAAVLLLAAASANQLEAAADARERHADDRAAFARSARERPGGLGRLRVVRRANADLVCGRVRPSGGWICTRVRHGE
jgi:hypothetical protein